MEVVKGPWDQHYTLRPSTTAPSLTTARLVLCTMSGGRKERKTCAHANDWRSYHRSIQVLILATI